MKKDNIINLLSWIKENIKQGCYNTATIAIDKLIERLK